MLGGANILREGRRRRAKADEAEEGTGLAGKHLERIGERRGHKGSNLEPLRERP
jgi:hypothetical protein